ncbi:hypothetical protein HY637_03130 [Candidatus Woesearchaeota archaeon]|nr:hypothetical protein [Candidatus Woesearchaeota archaeon]
MELSKREKRKLRLEKLRQESHEAQKEHEQRLEHQKQFEASQEKSKKTKYYVIGAVIVVLILSIITYSAYSMGKPSAYDSFAKCLTEKGAVMYGAMDWCKYTQGQKAMFGKSFKYINYHDFSELQGIKKTPTWVISGQWYENVQTFDKLASLTGCKI